MSFGDGISGNRSAQHMLASYIVPYSPLKNISIGVCEPIVLDVASAGYCGMGLPGLYGGNLYVSAIPWSYTPIPSCVRFPFSIVRSPNSATIAIMPKNTIDIFVCPFILKKN